jgi:hypothetical protein
LIILYIGGYRPKSFGEKYEKGQKKGKGNNMKERKKSKKKREIEK